MKNIYLAGHKGMVGSSILRKLQKEDNNIIFKDSKELDLTNQEQVYRFFKKNKISEVYVAAAKVGGIHANNFYPAEFIYKNLMIQSNVLHAAHQNDVQKLLFLGSSCIYPRLSDQPIKESALLNGYLEPTNEPYAIAKIAGIKMCESYNRQFQRDYRSVMPTNLYGPNDNFHTNNSHVIPALIKRIHEAKINDQPIVSIWGSGNPRREFLYVDDMAEASVYLMNISQSKFNQHSSPMCSHINVGTGLDVTIKELANSIKSIVGYPGDLVFDTSKLDGPPRKLLDVKKINDLGWKSKVNLETGLEKTYSWFCKNLKDYRSS